MYVQTACRSVARTYAQLSQLPRLTETTSYSAVYLGIEQIYARLANTAA